MKTAIIVEDHGDTREGLAALLGDAFPGIEVAVESTVAGGLQALSERAFGLALLDISLPDGNGVTLVEWLRRHAPDTYIVMATIFDDDDHLFTALRAGAQQSSHPVADPDPDDPSALGPDAIFFASLLICALLGSHIIIRTRCAILPESSVAIVVGAITVH